MGKIFKQAYDYRAIALVNLYRAFLQREPDPSGLEGYRHSNFDTIRDSLLRSDEYNALCENKKNIKKIPIDKKINYTIIKIDNRADETIKDIHAKLENDFTYCENIKFVDGRVEDVYEFFNSRGININWCGELFGHGYTTSPTELAVAASHIVALEYIINNNLDHCIVLEDDIILQDNAIDILSNCIAHLPIDYDFMADSTLEPHHEELSTEEHSVVIDSNLICRSYLQNAHTGFMLYSRQGAENIIKQYKKFGVMCAVDTFLFWMSRRGNLNGYTTYHSNRIVKYKDFFGTLIQGRT